MTDAKELARIFAEIIDADEFLFRRLYQLPGHAEAMLQLEAEIAKRMKPQATQSAAVTMPEEAKELKACAHCGGEATWELGFPSPIDSVPDTFRIMCMMCRIGTKHYARQMYAVAVWNRRATGTGDKIQGDTD